MPRAQQSPGPFAHLDGPMRSFRRFFIVLAELVQVFSLLLWTIGGAWGGARVARVAFDYGYLWNLPQDNALHVGMVLGGLIGFVISATAAAIVFAFAQIELNTRVVARYYAERTKTERAIDRVVKAREL